MQLFSCAVTQSRTYCHVARQSRTRALACAVLHLRGRVVTQSHTHGPAQRCSRCRAVLTCAIAQSHTHAVPHPCSHTPAVAQSRTCALVHSRTCAATKSHSRALVWSHSCAKDLRHGHGIAQLFNCPVMQLCSYTVVHLRSSCATEQLPNHAGARLSD